MYNSRTGKPLAATSANTSLRRDVSKTTTNSSYSSIARATEDVATNHKGATDGVASVEDVLPHRRRKQQQQKEQQTLAASVLETDIPPDGASEYTKSAESSQSSRKILKAYFALSKPHLTALVVLTSMASYALYPTSELLSSEPSAPTTALSALTLLFLTVGTALCSASANSLNMMMEPAFDAQMSRTRNRPLVRGIISKRQALLFAIITGTTGVMALYYGINPTVSALGLGNIVLYAGVYTPLKRIHVINTWVGALVGGIPPLMGWAAAANADATDEDWMTVISHPGGWLLAALLFAWQFPHFNAISWSIRKEYAAAGFKMLASTNVPMTARVGVRYSVLLFPICWGLWYTGVTDPVFAFDSSIINAWLLYEAIQFWKYEGERGTAKRLFWASVWHLPVVLVLAMAHKKGLWRGMYDGVMGRGQPEMVEEWEDYEDDDGVSIVAGTAR